MPVFQAKIEPFCAFTINLGPQYVERVFDSLLTKQGVGGMICMDPADRLEGYLEYLHKQVRYSNRNKYSFIQFYIGHFSQQLAGQPRQKQNGRHLMEKALCHYQVYLELADCPAESRYYAQWQSGLLQDDLQYPWSQAEASLLKADSLDPIRGEALKKMIDHYYQAKFWKTAYGLSALAIQMFFDKSPIATRRWFVDFDAYNWNLVHRHLTICYKLGYSQEAEQAYQQIHPPKHNIASVS